MTSAQKGYIAFFDLDRTIIRINSGYALARVAYGEGYLGIKDLWKTLSVLVLFKLKLRDTGKLITGIGEWLGGLKREEVELLAYEAVNRYLLKSVYREFAAELAFHRSNGAKTAILSSAITEVCEPLAGKLGIDVVLSTDMECINGIYSGSPSGRFCYGEERRNRISLFCREQGYSASTAYYYADSASDLPALEIVGNAVCVNPDKTLRKRALEKKWRICYWKQ